MRCAIVAFMLVLLPLRSSAQQVKKGDRATVPGWTRVEVKNPEPVKSVISSVGYGEFCGIQQGSTVTVVGIEGDRLLVRYSIGGGGPRGTPCLSGVVFFTTKEAFSKMTAEYHRVQKAEQDELELVRRLLR